MKIKKIIFNFINRYKKKKIKELPKALKKFNAEPLYPSKEFMNKVMDSQSK